ncbi:formyltetrahydrofolate deformylase [Flexibacter flexilis DSM 6793]|uniref:Formyltetrahydrofolate deformylase n=1 Tax=Flexibacter flexilis DSM 6793 TaxID=927664 RepID=A0A1I1DV30_9BACT|nr:formyltetrahydrofolate deformylase [Flexibacter flexilis]SFB78825.1 formyltetrahydrofolate deformylase [Flexibacter flexilis DSM 6793]
MKQHSLMIDCPDHKGLVHHITGVLFDLGLNVTQNDEFVSEDGRFFMRTEFEGEVNEEMLTTEMLKVLPEQDSRLRLNPKKNKNIVVLATKEHHCLADLLVRYSFDELNANILAVISNYNQLQSLVSRFGIPFHYISHDDQTREQHEEAIFRAIDIYQPDYLVLAKYMRVLTPAFVNRYQHRIINIHHSFLPAFVGANPYKQAYERGVKIIGATAHFVNNDLDEGPIIAQSIKNIDHRYSAKDMAVAGRDIEKIVLSQALQLVFQDRVFINGNRTIIF